MNLLIAVTAGLFLLSLLGGIYAYMVIGLPVVMREQKRAAAGSVRQFQNIWGVEKRLEELARSTQRPEVVKKWKTVRFFKYAVMAASACFCMLVIIQRVLSGL